MEILDNLNEIKKLDSSNALSSIEKLPEQIRQAADDLSTLNVPSEYSKVNKVVVAGMGGSSYGARIIKSLFSHDLKIPFELANDYQLPGFVDSETLVILSSFSGSTEEVLSTAKEAVEKKAKIMGICSGGKLADFLKENSCPAYIFTPKFNPSNQPRLGQGYMIVGQMLLLKAAGVIEIGEEEMGSIISQLNTNNKLYDLNTPLESNKAKQAAEFFYNSIPVLISGGFLEGACYAVRNPINENSKNMGFYFILPELNHHLLEGLAYPTSNKDNLKFLMIDSEFYPEVIKKRLELTKDVIEKNSLKSQTFKLNGGDKITQAVELVHFGSWVSFYLAMLNNLDPSPIPWVDYFKSQMG